MARTIAAVLLSALLPGLPAVLAQEISFNRTAGEVQVGTCEGLKTHAELGVDISIIVTANLRCSETITVPPGVDVSIGSAVDGGWVIAIAEDFSVPDPSSVNLLVNPRDSYLSLDQLGFVNEAGTVGSPGEVRAVWNEGTLDIAGCSFYGLNYASQQDGGAVRGGRDERRKTAAAYISKSTCYCCRAVRLLCTSAPVVHRNRTVVLQYAVGQWYAPACSCGCVVGGRVCRMQSFYFHRRQIAAPAAWLGLFLHRQEGRKKKRTSLSVRRPFVCSRNFDD